MLLEIPVSLILRPRSLTKGCDKSFPAITSLTHVLLHLHSYCSLIENNAPAQFGLVCITQFSLK